MPEEEKIRKVIEKYLGYLISSDADVAQTEKGVWFFLIHDADAESYYRFFRFKTAEELEQCIVETMADDLNCLFEVSVEAGCTVMCGKDVGGGLDGVSCAGYIGALTQLGENCAVLNQICQKAIPKLKVILGSLPGVSAD